MVSCRYLLWFQSYKFQWMGIDENFKSPYLGNYKEFRTFEGKRAVFIGVQEHAASIRFSLSLTVFEIWLFTLTPCKCNRVSRPILSVVDPKTRTDGQANPFLRLKGLFSKSASASGNRSTGIARAMIASEGGMSPSSLLLRSSHSSS